MNNIIKQQVIGIDVGVKKTSLALVDLRGTILAQDAMNTKDYPSVSSFVEALSERIIQLAEQNGGYETIRSVGISVQICLGRASYHSLLCCVTAWAWLWHWATMPM